MPGRGRATLLVGLLALLASCRQEKLFRSSIRLGGEEISAETLETGRAAYDVYCRNCHGPLGDGEGPVGWRMKPRPRDFTKGAFKFAGVRAGDLPRDEDLLRTLRQGLPGTGMLAWPVPDEKLLPIVHYIKTFSPAWQLRRAGEAVPMSPDPWQGREAEAVARGRLVYHGRARCQACHPAYVSDDEVVAAIRTFAGAEAEVPRRPAPESPVVGDSSYGPLAATDFRRNRLRSGTAPEDLYRTIACGVGGTAMPTWKGGLPEEDLWALVHYVRGLVPDQLR